MKVTMKLSADERRRGVDLRDVLGGRPPKTSKKKAPKAPKTKATPSVPASEYRPIEFVETTLHDPVRDRWEAGCDEGGVRLYCTSSPHTHGKENGRWALQVRAQVKNKRGGYGKHFAISSASMSREDLQWLRDQISAALRKGKSP